MELLLDMMGYIHCNNTFDAADVYSINDLFTVVLYINSLIIVTMLILNYKSFVTIVIL